ncbi:MAG: hypothetical protein ACXACW_16435 [Candidatus Hodarchaeales archaeon]
MLILFNGKVGPRGYRILVFLMDGELYIFRPYVGLYHSWPEGWEVFGQELMGEF